MSNLGPWHGITADLAHRLIRATGDIARRNADLQREVRRGLDGAAGIGRDDIQLATGFLFTEPRVLPGARGAIPPSGRFPPYTPSAAETHVASRHLVVDFELTRALHGQLEDERISSVTGALITRDPDGVLYMYKPFVSETFLNFNWLPHQAGQLGIREVAGFRVFELMGASRVPPTALVDGPMGPGVAQLYVPMKPSKNWSRYPEEHQAQAAMGHFIAGAADGHPGNYRPLYNGTLAHRNSDDLVVYDLGHTFPESPDHLRGGQGVDFKSDFIRNWSGREFPAPVLEPTQAITRDQMGSALEDLSLSDNAIDGALFRLDYVKTNDTIYRA
ncbi:hypothetical protein AB0M34_03160 [Nocardia sp. NPDC050193]